MKPLLSFLALSSLLRFTVLADVPPNLYPNLEQNGRLSPCVSGFLGQDLHPYILPVDTELIQRRHNFGFSSDEIQKYFDFPTARTLDSTGLDMSLLKPVPAPGIHPRLIFNPEDVPIIRQRLQTASGKVVMDDIRAHIKEVATGPKAKWGAEYNRLANGDLTTDFYSDSNRDLGYTLMYEAFRCLMDDDQVGGQKVAAAFTTMAQVEQKQVEDNISKEKSKFEKAEADHAAAVERWNAADDAAKAKMKEPGPEPEDGSNDFRNMALGPTMQGTLGLDYDFAYNFMTDEQRYIIRKALAVSSANMTNIGCETLRALHSGTSNWISWSNRMIFVAAAIEGEPGYDAGTYHRCENAQINFITSMYPTGEAYEGWGKNFMFLEHMVIMAKRGNYLLACTPVRAVYNDYFISSMNPWGNAFTFCDSLGGSNCKIARNADVLMYHALFPKDISGDFVYRNQISSDYANIIPGAQVNTHHPFSVMDALCCAIFVTDMMPGDPQKEYLQVTTGRPLTYFSQDTCNVMTRSEWSPDALYLNYLNRSIPGGHEYCDRSNFSFYGLGRYWGIYHVMRQVGAQYGPENRSVLLADGEGPSIIEGKCVNFTDRAMATFTATDLTQAWDYQNAGLVKPATGTETIQEPFSFNSFRFQLSPIPWMNMPIGQLPDWYTSEKPDPKNKADWYKRPVQVVKAFRTAGLVRGPHPYCLIVDDLQKDNQIHSYDWGMILADDVTMGSSKFTGDTSHASGDVILNENPKADPKSATPPEKDRHLLIRVMSASALDRDKFASVALLSVANPPQKDMQLNKLHITSTSVSPDFKMLLFPFKDGQALPTTTWSADHQTVTIAWPDQSDEVTFAVAKDGRTRLKVVRNSDELISVD